MYRELDFDQVAHEDQLMECKVDFAVLVNHMEHKTVGEVYGSCKVVDIGYYLPHMDQQD